VSVYSGMALQPIRRIAIVGFGEAGGIFGNDFARQGFEVSAFDILLNSRGDRVKMLSKARTSGVRAARDLKSCLQDVDLVISAVTACSCLQVAKSARPLLGRGQTFLDINSVSPQTKRKAAAFIQSGKGRFLEAAVMAAVPGQRLKVPMFLAGPHVAEEADRLREIGMNPTALSGEIGVASAVKMCRSVMIKGIEALTVECLFAARRYGAEQAVLQSLAATYPNMKWTGGLPDYLISRVAEHGMRRAAEMKEVGAALQDVGVEPAMALATAGRQAKLIREMAARKIDYDAGKKFVWQELADALHHKRRQTRRKPS